MSILRISVLAIAAMLVCSCSSWRDWRMEKSVERSRKEALAKIDQHQCRTEGGSVRGVGMFGTPACVKPFADAGRACSDKSECEGLCEAADDAVIGSRSAGTCQKDTHDFYGCYNEVKQGLVIGGMCFD